jgi:hypothetical protein
VTLWQTKKYRIYQHHYRHAKFMPEQLQTEVAFMKVAAGQDSQQSRLDRTDSQQESLARMVYTQEIGWL